MKLPKDVVSQLKSLRVLIDMKELEVLALKDHMSKLLVDVTGVDIRKGDWVLDLDSEELREQNQEHPTHD